MSTTTLEKSVAFDDADRLNEDGTVTFRIIPSNWHAYNISPDTYQSYNGDSWNEYIIEHHREETGLDLGYDDFSWTYNHSGIVRGLAEVAAEWIQSCLWDLGLDSISDVKVVDSWSPTYYNFQSDGFEVELTCDPTELRALTPDFDVDEHGTEFYKSYDGFRSFVTGRLDEDEWRAQYDAEFRIEHLLASADDAPERGHVMAMAEAEWEVYDEHTQYELIHPEYEDSGYTLVELEEWAASLTPTQEETLPLD